MSSICDAAALGYMGNYSRKLRKTVSTSPAGDAAGLAVDNKFAGRATPLKGKGCPPQDQKEDAFRSAKHFVQGSSFVDNDVLITSRPVSAEDTSFRATKHFVDGSSFKGNLSGTSAQVSSDAPTYRKSRSFSSAAPDRTLETTAGKLFGAGPVEPQRPHLKCTMDRPAGSEDVLKYRFSEGISTKEYKMTDTRVPAPNNQKVDLSQSKTSFQNATCDYSKNKYRGQGTAIVFG